MILLDVTPEDLEEIEPLVSAAGFDMPNVKASIYKNRRGQFNRVLLWMKADKGTCRYKTLFATDYNLNLVDILQ